MATLETIKQQIESSVYQNNTQAITGQSLQNTLKTMAEGLYVSNPVTADAQTLTTAQKRQARRNIDAMGGTPSGDPLHYAYESVGAVFNDDTGFWELNGITDLTDDEMRAIYSAGHLPIEQLMFHESSAISNLRTHLTKIGLGYKELNMNHFASYNSTIEVINLMGYNIGTDLETIPTAIYTNNINYAFTDCNMLKKVYGAIHFTSNSEESIILDTTFEGCYNLETVYISNFGVSEDSASIYFTSSDNISESSIAYLIENACNDTYLEIYLTGYAFSRIETSGEVAEAIMFAEENGCTINIYNY